MHSWKIAVLLLFIMTLFISLNEIYILQPMKIKMTQAQAEQQLLQAKTQLELGWQHHAVKIQNKEVDWNAALQRIIQRAQLQLMSMQVEQAVVKSTDVLIIRLQLQGTQTAIFNIWSALFTSEMPLIITNLEIKPDQTTTAFTLSITMLMLEHISLMPIDKPPFVKYPILCQATMLPIDVPLQSFSMHGYISQTVRQQALLAAGLNVVAIVSVGDVIGEEHATVSKILPHVVYVTLANHQLQPIPMVLSNK